MIFSFFDKVGVQLIFNVFKNNFLYLFILFQNTCLFVVDLVKIGSVVWALELSRDIQTFSKNHSFRFRVHLSGGSGGFLKGIFE